jgi:hypothetical protein
MKKKIKEVKLSKDYQTNECFIPKGTSAIINFTGDMFLFKNRGYVKQFTLKEINPMGELSDVAIFDIEYEPERKKICVVIELNEIDGYPKVKFKEVETALKSHFCHTDRNIKVTEIKPVTKEDVEWFYNAGWRRPCNNFNSLWAEFQARKEAENG